MYYCFLLKIMIKLVTIKDCVSTMFIIMETLNFDLTNRDNIRILTYEQLMSIGL